MPKSVHTAGHRRLRAELRRCREAAGLSQRELAARLRVSHSWVAKVEGGERRIDLIELCWFVRACGADPLDLLPPIVRTAGSPPFRRSGGGGRPR